MKYALIFFGLAFLAGCGKPAGDQTTLTPAQREEREKNVFWQYTEPSIQLDPIAEKDAPLIVYPGPTEEEQ
jgi:hypothetical protein